MADVPENEAPVVHFSVADLKDARERSELSLIARIFWDELHDLRSVENSFISIWKCGRVRIFDFGFGLYQFIFPTVAKQNWCFECARTNLMFNPDARNSWMCITPHLDEEELTGASRSSARDKGKGNATLQAVEEEESEDEEEEENEGEGEGEEDEEDE
ncbi:hypothetical protein LINPERHAP2_LOCUS39586 [Linum perenne]